ncbi:DUF3048 domain-containing protein [Candidatus Dojkabacteria bacterium]|jgi:hypothetical protein|nr:DUF3048 domain-containing protein [Candidatus Dojkabacteria bacterium]
MKEIKVEQDLPKAPEKKEEIVPKEPLIKAKPKGNWGFIILIISGSLVCIGALVFLYFFVIKLPTPVTEIISLSGNYISPEKVNSSQSLELIAVPSVPKTEASPINGELFTKTEMAKLMKRRPVAVTISNVNWARPQSGLYKADLVYETLVEGGITRFMAIFWSDGPTKVGPVRSARQYFLEWLSPFDPIFIHDGCASTKDPRTNACGNIVLYGIKNNGLHGYWMDPSRVRPHNEYNSVAVAWDYAKTMGWTGFPKNFDEWKFKKDASLDDRGNKTKVKIRFRNDLPNGGLYDTTWVYNKESNLYTHYSNGVKDIDLDTKKTINAKTVIVEEIVMPPYSDDHGRVVITTIGQGKVTVLMDGKIVKGTWKKDSRTERTKYYDKAGKELVLNRGTIWICAVSKEKGTFDIIEQ